LLLFSDVVAALPSGVYKAPACIVKIAKLRKSEIHLTSFTLRTNMTNIAMKFLKSRVAKTFAKKKIWEAMKKVINNLQRLEVYILMKSQDLLTSIRANIGSATDGSRAWPKSTLDKKLGVRLDYGERFQLDGSWFRNIVLQLNKDAENAAINELAKKDTHAKRAIITVPLSEDGKGLHSDINIEDFRPVVEEGV
jgi:hypothetical protein